MLCSLRDEMMSSGRLAEYKNALENGSRLVSDLEEMNYGTAMDENELSSLIEKDFLSYFMPGRDGQRKALDDEAAAAVQTVLQGNSVSAYFVVNNPPEISEVVDRCTDLAAIRLLLRSQVISLDNATTMADMQCSDEDDDGGPVVFVERELTWEQLVWTIFIEIFGSKEQASMVMQYLALGLSTDSNGGIIMLMHGQETSGKSLFLSILNMLFGKNNKLVRAIPQTFESCKDGARWHSTFTESNLEVRFFVESNFSLLDGDEGDAQELKQKMGNSSVITASNKLPCIEGTMAPGQKKLMMVPTLSEFVTDKAALRKEILLYMANDRFRRLFSNVPFPAEYSEYVQLMNLKANCMFSYKLEDFGAQNALFNDDVNFLDHDLHGQVGSLPVSILKRRWLLRDTALESPEALEKLGAALCRILLKKIVPSIGGLNKYPDVIRKITNYVEETFPIFSSYKDALIVALKGMILKRADKQVNVEEVRARIRSQTATVEEAVESVHGKHHEAARAAFSKLENAVKDKREFEQLLTSCGFELKETTDGLALNGFDWIEDANQEIQKEKWSLLEALLLSGDIGAYKHTLPKFSSLKEEDDFTRGYYLLDPPCPWLLHIAQRCD
ncbi:hypothetical protein MTO96_035442 [Rhipicephalus appendiculatus]